MRKEKEKRSLKEKIKAAFELGEPSCYFIGCSYLYFILGFNEDESSRQHNFLLTGSEYIGRKISRKFGKYTVVGKVCFIDNLFLII